MITQERKYTNLQHRRHLGGQLITQGYRNCEIVKILQCSLSSVKLWRKIVEAQGIEGLAPKPMLGRKPKLDKQQLAKLKRLLKKGAIKFGYTNAIWTSRRVRQLIKDQFDIIHSSRQVRRILRKIGYSPQKPVKRAKKYSAKKVEHWRRYKWPLIKKVA